MVKLFKSYSGWVSAYFQAQIVSVTAVELSPTPSVMSPADSASVKSVLILYSQVLFITYPSSIWWCLYKHMAQQYLVAYESYFYFCMVDVYEFYVIF